MNTSKVYESAFMAGYNLGMAVIIDHFEKILIEYEKHEDKISIKELRKLINDNYKKYDSIGDKTYSKKEFIEKMKNTLNV